jgi:hypothetical protein
VKEIIKTVYRCDYCGLELESIDEMFKHEDICPHNPQNMPCSQCKNMIIGVGCKHKMDISKVGGNVFCFFYEEGVPSLANPFTFILDGGDK